MAKKAAKKAKKPAKESREKEGREEEVVCVSPVHPGDAMSVRLAVAITHVVHGGRKAPVKRGAGMVPLFRFGSQHRAMNADCACGVAGVLRCAGSSRMCARMDAAGL